MIRVRSNWPDSAAKNEMRDPAAYASEGGDNPHHRRIAQIYGLYCERLMLANAMDFDDLLLNAVAMLKKDGDVLSSYQHRFRYLLVDEFQDTNGVQNQLVMMLAERHQEYVKNPKGLKSPFMMMTFDTKDNFREFIAAVHNADLTCRAQLVDEPTNPAMYAILKAFEKKTGRAVVLNTSFNLHGYPIVRTPEEALHVFRQSGLEYLQVGNFIVRKS